MKYLFISILLFVFNNSNAQFTIEGSCPENVWQGGEGSLIGHNKIKHTGTDSFNISWEVTNWSMPADWDTTFAFCDYEFCRSPGIMKATTIDTFFPGAIGDFKPQFTPPYDGTGSFEITVWRTDDSATTVTSCSWIVEYSDVNDVVFIPRQVFPNPAIDYIQIDIIDEFPSTGILIDFSGRVINSNIAIDVSTGKIDLSHISSGIYCLILDSGSERFSYRFTKL